MLLHAVSDVSECLFTSLCAIEGAIVIMAGHYALVQHRETGELVPAVVPDIDHAPTREFVRNHHYMGNFPLETWKMGVDLVARLRAMGRDAKLLVLVNDWQHVPAARSGERHLERDVYFAKAALPPALDGALRAAGLDESALLMDVRDQRPTPLWAESKLRARYHRHLKVRVPVDSPCAQEWVPILVRLEERGCGGFAAFIPSVCRVPIIGGTERAEEYLDLALKTVIVSPSGDESDFWANAWIEGA